MGHPAELDWPFFDDAHRDFKSRLDAWCHEHLAHAHHDESRDAVDAECVRLVRLLGQGGWLRHAVAGTAYWNKLFELAERHDFIVLADECYADIWFDAPPVCALTARFALA